jgi:hypothetical protein
MIMMIFYPWMKLLLTCLQHRMANRQTVLLLLLAIPYLAYACRGEANTIHFSG